MPRLTFGPMIYYEVERKNTITEPVQGEADTANVQVQEAHQNTESREPTYNAHKPRLLLMGLKK